jgi:serine/threonine-protein kinase
MRQFRDTQSLASPRMMPRFAAPAGKPGILASREDPPPEPVGDPDAETRIIPPAADPDAETRIVPPATEAEADTGQVRRPLEFSPPPEEREAPEPSPRGELAAGSRFGGFVIEAEIARGEMGVVYRARRVRLDRVEALKVIAPKYVADPAFRDRFGREAKNAVLVNHPHVVTVYDADELDGHLFIAMQYVDGVDLRHRLQRDGALPPALAVDIASQVASALDAAHAAGLIHRDVKPGNILLAGDPREPFAYLSDFGVSRRVALPNDLTQPGSSVGTPYYTAPEQELGRPVDHRADVYSLGCVLFETLTGSRPYTGDSLTAVALAHVQNRVPSARRLNPALPSAIDRVLEKALAKDPRERFQSAGQLAAGAVAALAAPDTDEIERTQPLTPPPPPRTPPVEPRRRRRSARAVLGQVLALVACVAFAGVVLKSSQYLNGDSLWDVHRGSGHPPSKWDFWIVLGLAALAAEFVLLSLGFLPRTMGFFALASALALIVQLLRLQAGLNLYETLDKPTTDPGFWRSLALAGVIAVGATLILTARRRP